MFFKKVLLASVVFTGSLMASAAHAASVTIDFTGSKSPVTSLDFMDIEGSGIDLSVSARLYDKKTGEVKARSYKVGLYEDGLGVCSGRTTTSGTFCTKDDFQIDGHKRKEMVLFSFSQDVRLTEIIFSMADSDDDFAFRNLDVADGFIKSTSVPIGGYFRFSQLNEGAAFGIGATQQDDAFQIRSLTFEQVIHVIPLPASGMLLLIGIVGLAACNRRRR